MVETCLGVGKPYLDENGEKTGMYLFEDSTKFTSVGSVYAQVSETGGITMKIDPDHDGVYDTEVEKGDVNCDGLKDGADASLILYNNAQQVDDWETYLDNRYADMNGDGMIDGVDASLILAMNAELAGETA